MKRFSVLGFVFFVGEVISEVRLGLFGRGYQILGPNDKREAFRSSF